MANITSIHGDPIGALKHNLRERDKYQNPDIDPEKSKDNYVIEAHGKTSGEIYAYYRSMVDGVYHRGKGTVLNSEIIITAPEDLSQDKEREFFEVSTKFLDEYLFDGNTSRVLLSVVHKDERGSPHLHYCFTFPEVKNEKYIQAKEKFSSGLKYISEEFGVSPTKEQKSLLLESINQFEKIGDINNAIHEISNVLTLDRDNARKVFLKLRRTDKELAETRLMSRDEFLTKKVYDNLHPEFQKYINDNGPKCTVFQGSGKINITVQQLKAYTARTGKTVPKEVLKDLTVEKVLSALEKERGRDAWSKDPWHEKEKREDVWEREY